MGAPRRRHEGEASSSSRSPTPTSAAARREPIARCAQGPGEIEIVAHASRGDARQIHRYLPRSIDEATRRWLGAALVERQRGRRAAQDCRKSRRLSVRQRQGRQADVHHEGEGVTLAHTRRLARHRRHRRRRSDRRHAADDRRGARRGCTAWISARRTWRLPTSPPMPAMLRIEGEAAGPIAGFLRYVNESPVAARIGQITSDAEAVGSGRLRAQDRASARAAARTSRSRAISRSPRRSCAFAGAPLLTQARRQAVVHRTRSQRARRHGGNPRRTGEARHDRRSAARRACRGTGTFGLAALRREYANAVSRSRVRKPRLVDERRRARSGTLGWVFESNHERSGGRSARRRSARRRPRRCRCASKGATRRVRPAPISSSPRMAAWRSSPRTARRADGSATIDRALLVARPARSSAATPRRAERPGLWIRGELPALNVDDWIACAAALGPRTNPRSPIRRSRFAGADLDVASVRCDGRAIHRSQAAHARSAEGLDVRYRWSRSRRHGELVGARRGRPNGRIVARLAADHDARVAAAPRRGEAPKPGGRQRRASGRAGRQSVAGNRSRGGRAAFRRQRDLGRLEFVAQPQGADWRIDRLVPRQRQRAQLEANGAWRVAGPARSRRSSTSSSTRRIPARSSRVTAMPRALQGARRRGSTVSSHGPARRTSSTFSYAQRDVPHPRRARAGSPSSSRARASCSACCRCRRCRDA